MFICCSRFLSLIVPPAVYHKHVLLPLLLENEQLIWSVAHVNSSWNMSKRAWVHEFAWLSTPAKATIPRIKLSHYVCPTSPILIPLCSLANLCIVTRQLQNFQSATTIFSLANYSFLARWFSHRHSLIDTHTHSLSHLLSKSVANSHIQHYKSHIPTR
jgi:hypothetical protein